MFMLEFLLSVKEIPSWDRTPAISDKDLDELINGARLLEQMATMEKQCHAVCPCDDLILKSN